MTQGRLGRVVAAAMRVPAALVVAMLGLAMLTGCESGPSGPGTITLRVEAPATVGAVTLEVVGRGIEGFAGEGDTRAYGVLVSAERRVHRVVLIHPDGGGLRVGVEVQDLDMDDPVATVLSAAGTDNLPHATSGIAVQVER